MIRLRPDGTNIARRNDKKIKLTVGRPTAATNAVVRLPGDASKPLLIAEGTENADSAAAISGFEAWATLGPIPRIEPPAGRDAIVLSDGDDPDKPAAIDFEAWVAKWRGLGRRIVIARPRPEWTGHRTTSTTTAPGQGPGAVLDRIRGRVKRGAGTRFPVPHSEGSCGAVPIGGWCDCPDRILPRPQPETRGPPLWRASAFQGSGFGRLLTTHRESARWSVTLHDAPASLQGWIAVEGVRYPWMPPWRGLWPR